MSDQPPLGVAVAAMVYRATIREPGHEIFLHRSHRRLAGRTCLLANPAAYPEIQQGRKGKDNATESDARSTTRRSGRPTGEAALTARRLSQHREFPSAGKFQVA